MPAKKKTAPPEVSSPSPPLTPEAPFALTGLREDNPRDFLAALGILRLMNMLWLEHQPKLSWNNGGHPMIHVESALPESWALSLWNHVKELDAADNSPFRHDKIEGISSGTFRTLLTDEHEPQLFQRHFYPSLAGQITHEKGGRRSHLIIESANRSVLNGTRDLLRNERYHPDVVAEITGCSSLSEVKNTPRWHPGEAQSAAYCAADPKDNKHFDRLSLNVFAVLGLTFYPVVDGLANRETLGTMKVKGQDRCFSWPIHEFQASCDVLMTILHDIEVHSQDPSPSILKSRGIRSLWRSRRYNLNQNDYFSPGEAIF